MDVLTTLGRTMGFSFAVGINLYATVAILGLASRYDWVALPPQFKVFDNDIVIGAAIVLYVVEFIADKIPWVDSIWDAAHTVIRPLGGALIAVATLGHASPTVTSSRMSSSSASACCAEVSGRRGRRRDGLRGVDDRVRRVDPPRGSQTMATEYSGNA